MMINLIPSSDYRNEHYGIIFESSETYYVPQSNNPSHPHRIQVWERREGSQHPTGRDWAEDEHVWVQLSAEAIVISRDRPSKAPAGRLGVGEVVGLYLSGVLVGERVVRAARMSSPELV